MEDKIRAAHVFNQARLNNDEKVLVGLKHNISSGYSHTLLSSLIKWPVIFLSLIERGNPFTSLMLSSTNYSIPNHTHTCHSITSTLGVCQSIR